MSWIVEQVSASHERESSAQTQRKEAARKEAARRESLFAERRLIVESHWERLDIDLLLEELHTTLFPNSELSPKKPAAEAERHEDVEKSREIHRVVDWQEQKIYCAGDDLYGVTAEVFAKPRHSNLPDLSITISFPRGYSSSEFQLKVTGLYPMPAGTASKGIPVQTLGRIASTFDPEELTGPEDLQPIIADYLFERAKHDASLRANLEFMGVQF